MPLIKTIEHRFKDLVYWLIQVFIRKSDPRLVPVDLSGGGSLLFLRYDRLGDMIVSLPVFKTVKDKYPNVKIDLFCSPENAQIVAKDPAVNQLFIYRKNVITDISQMLRLRKQKYKAVVDLINGDSTSGLILSSLCAGQSPKIGVQKNKYKRFYDYAFFQDSTERRHTILNTMEVLKPLGINPETFEVKASPFLSANALKTAEQFIETLKDSPESNENMKLVGVNLSVGKPTRQWPTEKYQELLNKINQQVNHKVKLILMTTPKERYLAEQLLKEAAEAVCVIPPSLTLEVVSAIISKLDLMISPDTSIVHIARAFDIPVVGLYTNAEENFKQWHPFEFIHGAVLSSDVNGLKDISVEQVFAKYVEISDAVFNHSKEAS